MKQTILLFNQDQTTWDHTWLHYWVFLVSYQYSWCHQDDSYLVKVHHEHKIFFHQWLPREVNNQRYQCNISIHSSIHIFLSIHHRNHILVLFVLINDFLLAVWFYFRILLWVRVEVGRFRRCRGHDRRNHRGRDRWRRVPILLFWRVLVDRRIVHGYLRIL